MINMNRKKKAKVDKEKYFFKKPHPETVSIMKEEKPSRWKRFLKWLEED